MADAGTGARLVELVRVAGEPQTAGELAAVVGVSERQARRLAAGAVASGELEAVPALRAGANGERAVRAYRLAADPAPAVEPVRALGDGGPLAAEKLEDRVWSADPHRDTADGPSASPARHDGGEPAVHDLVDDPGGHAERGARLERDLARMAAADEAAAAERAARDRAEVGVADEGAPVFGDPRGKRTFSAKLRAVLGSCPELGKLIGVGERTSDDGWPVDPSKREAAARVLALQNPGVLVLDVTAEYVPIALAEARRQSVPTRFAPAPDDGPAYDFSRPEYGRRLGRAYERASPGGLAVSVAAEPQGQGHVVTVLPDGHGGYRRVG